MYGVSDVRFHLFSNSYRPTNSDKSFETKFRNYDSSNLPLYKTNWQHHLIRVRYVRKCWKTPHLKHPTSLFEWCILRLMKLQSIETR